MSHTRAVSLMLLVTLLWSLAGVVSRHLDSTQSFEVTFWRSASTALTLAVALTVLRGPTFWTRLAHSSRAVWISGVCWGVQFTAFMVAVTLTTVANVLVMTALGPLITALFARVFLDHRLARRTWGAIAVAGVGIGWMFGQDAQSGVSLTGTLIAMAVPVAVAVNYTVLQHVGHAKDDETRIDMLPAVFIGALLSAAVTLPLAWPVKASMHDIGLLSFLGAVQLALPCLLVVRLSRELPAPEIALLGLLEVIFGVAWAWLGAGEVLSSSTLIGGMLVLGALIGNELVTLRERQFAVA